MSISRVDVENRTIDVVKSFKKINPDAVSLESNFIKELGVDDLDVIEIFMAIEEEFGIEVPDSVVAELTTVHQVANYVLTCSDAR